MRRINQCLSDSLGEIYKKTMAMESLQDKVIPLLPEELRSHCQVGSFNNSCLILVCPDAVWASQLRYLVPELRDQLRKGGFYQLSSIKIQVAARVAMRSGNNNHRQRRVCSISKESKNFIKKQSEQFDYDPLKKAMEKLGRA